MKFKILYIFIGVLLAFIVPEANSQAYEKPALMKDLNKLQPELLKTPDIIGDVEEEWVAIYNGVGSLRSDEATGIAVDTYGNVYVTGYSQGLDYYYDCATIKYDPNGEVLWISRYDGGFDDYAYKLAIDDAGNVYITGSSYSPVSDEDYLTIKYNTDGIEQWVKKFNGPGNSFDRSNDITIDDSGNVYVTGESFGVGTEKDYATIKYSLEGIEQWIIRYNGPQNSYDEAVAISIDKFCNVLVTGRSIGLNNQYNFATIKYSFHGVELWTQRFSLFGNYSDRPYDLAIDNLGNVIITGSGASLDSTSFTPDYLTIKYDSSGILQWTERYNGPGNDFDEARVVAVDDTGNIFITGWSRDEGGRNDYATIKYYASGQEQWVSRFNGGFVYDLAIDNSGNVYVTGISADSIIDYTTIKYDSDGTEEWIIKYNSYGLNMATAITIDEERNVYVTGILEVPGGIPTFDYGTVKYKQKTIPVELINFIASLNNNSVKLTWQTATEINNSGFEIKRKKSEDGGQVSEWEKIGFVPGYGTSTELNSYSFVDDLLTNVSHSLTLYYRLKQIDYDGSFEYSGIVEITLGVPQVFTLDQNYPNPFNPTTTIKYDLPNATEVSLIIYDILGRKVNELVNTKQQAGRYEIQFNATSLASGVYIYQLIAEKYISSKKMILLK